MDILIEGKKYDLKIEPRVLRSIHKGNVTLDGVIAVLTQNYSFLERIQDSTFLIKGKGVIVTGYKCDNGIEVEFADNPMNIKKISIGKKGASD